MKVLFLIPYPLNSAASQRFRFEQYLSILKENGIQYELSPFLSSGAWSIFYKKGFFLRKAFALIAGVLKRFLSCLTAFKYQYIFIHREVMPIGPPMMEWFLYKVLKKKIIYDFDDAIWISNSSETNRFFEVLKTHSNFFKICTYSHRISAGNEFLKNTAASVNNNVIVNPTTIDTVHLHNRLKAHTNELSVVGWTGSHSTLKYLDPLFPVIRNLKKKYSFSFVIISDESPKDNLDIFEFVKWNMQSEIDDLCRINIGVMPLTHDPWSEGKCGFKALQYMSLGIPALVSPIGVNEKIVDHGINGYICRNFSDWEKNIESLLINRERVIKMGVQAREKVVASYSMGSNTSNFLNLFAQ